MIDTRIRLLALVVPLFVATQAHALNVDLGGAGPVVALSQSIPVELAQSVSASDAKAAQGMIERLGNEALGAISNTGLDDTAKKQVFKRLLTQNFDMKTIGRFAMGKFWRTATPQQQTEYQRLYEKMIIDVYTARFNKYSGQTFEVTGNRVDDTSGDIVVSSNVKSDGSAPVSVDWRVRPKGGAYRIIDVMVEGVSMAVTQRNDFAGVIQQGGGTVDALLEYLKKGGTSDVKK